MTKLTIHLALHGMLILMLSVMAGLFLYRSILKKQNEASWHLLHAGGTARGIMLIALAAVIDQVSLPPFQLALAVWLIIYFVWTSTLAMLIRAFTDQPGFHWHGSIVNKSVFALYASGTLTLFPGMILLILGLIKTLSA